MSFSFLLPQNLAFSPSEKPVMHRKGVTIIRPVGKMVVLNCLHNIKKLVFFDDQSISVGKPVHKDAPYEIASSTQTSQTGDRDREGRDHC